MVECSSGRISNSYWFKGVGTLFRWLGVAGVRLVSPEVHCESPELSAGVLGRGSTSRAIVFVVSTEGPTEIPG